MASQKAKFELFRRLAELGFTYDESAQLRRIEMTLQRWAEGECGDGNDFSSWCITRDETTGKPYREVHPHTGKMHRYAIADREAGALRRLKTIVDARNARQKARYDECGTPLSHTDLLSYHQGDCRGCMLYLVPKSTLCDASGNVVLPIDQYYNRGLAVCA